MRKIIATLSILLTAAAMTMVSCQKDDTPIDTIYSGFMTAQTDDQGYVTRLTDDLGKSFDIDYKENKAAPQTSFRVLASLSIDRQNKASVNQMVLCIQYPPIEESMLSNENRTAADPLELQTYYIGGGYLNIKICVKVKTDEEKHDIIYSHKTGLDGKHAIRIYHDADGVKGMVNKYVYMSIPLKQYNINKNDIVSLSAKGEQKDYDVDILYR